MQPATMPPTTAATSPAISGAPDAAAIPSDKGIAIKKTTSEAGRSCRMMDLHETRSRAGSDGGGEWLGDMVGTGPSGVGAHSNGTSKQRVSIWLLIVPARSSPDDQ